MPESNKPSRDNQSTGRSVSRRRFLEGVGGTGIATALSGCSGSDGDGDGGDGGDGGGGDGGTGTVEGTASQSSVTVVWNTFERTDENKKKLKDALDLPDRINLEIQAQPGETTDDTKSQYNQWLSSSRTTPDILMPDTAWSIPFVVRDQVLNLSEHLSQEKLSYIEENFVDQLKPTVKGEEGNFFGVQHTTDIAGMQYRKDLIEDAGYDPEGENWASEGMTWKRFSNITKDVLEQNSDVEHGYAFQGRAYEGLSCCNYNEWMTSFGGAYFGGRENLFGPIGDRPITVEEEPHLKVLRMIRTFIHGQDDDHALDGYAGGIAPAANLQWAEETSRKPFTDGNAIMHRNWPYSWQINGAEDVFGDDLGVMPIPAGVSESDANYEGTGGVGRSFIGGWANMVNPNSENVDAAAGQVGTRDRRTGKHARSGGVHGRLAAHRAARYPACRDGRLGPRVRPDRTGGQHLPQPREVPRASVERPEILDSGYRRSSGELISP